MGSFQSSCGIWSVAFRILETSLFCFCDPSLNVLLLALFTFLLVFFLKVCRQCILCDWTFGFALGELFQFQLYLYAVDSLAS